jgi:hypothetical protein
MAPRCSQIPQRYPRTGTVKYLTVLAVALMLVSACGGDASGGGPTNAASAPGPLDCGQVRDGSKRAVRTFFAVLRSGDEQRVLDALATSGRFEWLNVGGKDGTPVLPTLRKKRRATAAAVAHLGGLPLRVTDFMTIDRPSRTMDFGFYGTWRGRKAVGKGALDCEQGRARVLSVALRFNVKPD